MGPGTIQLAYVGSLALMSAATALVGVAVYARSEGRHRGAFAANMGAVTVWIAIAAAGLALERPRLQYALIVLRNLVALGTAFGFGYVATVYTRRSTSLRRPRNALVAGWLLLAGIGAATAQVHGRYYSAVTYHTTPFGYYATEPGPMYVVALVGVYAVLSGGLYYLAKLFVKSHHRPTTSVALLGVASLATVVPSALETVGSVPILPGYDHTTFGIGPFAIVLAFALYLRGERDLAPVARDEIVEEIDDALFGLDDKGRLVDYNVAAAPLIERDDPIGEPLSTVAPDLASRLELPTDPDAGDVTAAYSADRAGGDAHYSVVASPIVERGTVAGYSVVCRDVTEIESYQAELERQNEQLEDFASTISHDLRDPMQAGDEYATLLSDELRSLDEDGDVEDLLASLEQIEGSIDRMDAIISDLRTLATQGQSVEATDVVEFSDAVEAAWTTVETRGATISVDGDGTIRAERSRLRTILENLLRNAVEHSSTSPRSQAHEDAVEHSSTSPRSQTREAAGHDVEIEVGLTGDGFYFQDDGPGVPEAERDRVFEYGYTTSQDGTGLGLNIVRTMVESHGWTVAIDPDYDDGTRILVTGASTSLESGVAPTVDRQRVPRRR